MAETGLAKTRDVIHLSTQLPPPWIPEFDGPVGDLARMLVRNESLSSGISQSDIMSFKIKKKNNACDAKYRVIFQLHERKVSKSAIARIFKIDRSSVIKAIIRHEDANA